MTEPIRLMDYRRPPTAEELSKMGLTPEFIAELDFPTFTVVATCPKARKSDGGKMLEWVDRAGSAITMRQAQALHDAGYLVLATRCHEYHRECVVKNSASRRPRIVTAIRPMSQPKEHRDVRS